MSLSVCQSYQNLPSFISQQPLFEVPVAIFNSLLPGKCPANSCRCWAVPAGWRCDKCQLGDVPAGLCLWLCRSHVYLWSSRAQALSLWSCALKGDWTQLPMLPPSKNVNFSSIPFFPPNLGRTSYELITAHLATAKLIEFKAKTTKVSSLLNRIA